MFWKIIRWPLGFAAGLVIDELLFSLAALASRPDTFTRLMAASLLTLFGAGVSEYVVRSRGWLVGLLYGTLKQALVVIGVAGIALADPKHPHPTVFSIESVQRALGKVYATGGIRLVLALLLAIPVGALGGHLVGQFIRKK